MRKLNEKLISFKFFKVCFFVFVSYSDTSMGSGKRASNLSSDLVKITSDMRGHRVVEPVTAVDIASHTDTHRHTYRHIHRHANRHSIGHTQWHAYRHKQ